MTILKKLWVTIYIIFITITLLLLFIWISNLFLKSSEFNDKWVKSYCQISKIMAKNGPNVYVSYWIEDSTGNTIMKADEYAASLSLSTPVIGETFPIVYNPQNPDEFFAFSWKPFFKKNEKTEFSMGTISRAPYRTGVVKRSQKISTHSIEFKFILNDMVYRKSQPLPPMFIQAYPEKVQKGSRFEIEYLVENPERVVLYLDKPIKSKINQ